MACKLQAVRLVALHAVRADVTQTPDVSLTAVCVRNSFPKRSKTKFIFLQTIDNRINHLFGRIFHYRLHAFYQCPNVRNLVMAGLGGSKP